MDALSSQSNKISWKLNGKIKKRVNMKYTSNSKNQMFQENNIAEIKHVVKTEKKDTLRPKSSELNSDTAFINISYTHVNYKTNNKIHNLESTKKPTNIKENCTRLYKNYAKTNNGTYYSVCSVYSSETKESSIKLVYCKKKKHKNKAIFYRDICITGEKIALWRKLKRKISSLTSTVNDCKFNMGNFTKQQSQRNKIYQEPDTCGTKKPKVKPFFQKFWNFYCKCDEKKNIKCTKVPLIQFPDLPEHCLYKKCSCLKQSSDHSIIKLRYSGDNNRCATIKNSKITLTNSKNMIVVKSSKTEIGLICGEQNIVATKGVSCDIDNAKYDTYTDMTEHILLQTNSTQYLEKDIETKSYEQIIIEKRCVSTQDDIQVECGDQNREAHENNRLNNKECFENRLLPQFTKNGNNICDKGRILIKKINKKYLGSIICKPEKKYYTRKTQTCFYNKKSVKYGTDDRKYFYRNVNKSIGIQCVTSNAASQTLKKNKYQRRKKVSVKTIGRNKSCMYELPLPELSTKRTQCGRQRPICKFQKHSNLVRLCKNLSCSKMNKQTCKYDTLNTSKSCKCNKKSVSVRKPCEKCTSYKKTRNISVETQCPIVKVPIRNEKNSFKKKFWKHGFSKVSDHTMAVLKKVKNSKENTLCQKKCSQKLTCKQSCNSVCIQCCPPKPTICTCTKDLCLSKSCNNIFNRKQPTCSIGTQENQMQNIHKMKHNWSLFNLKKLKPLEPCRCIQSLMFIDEAYRNYHINPALVSQIKRYENNCLLNQDCNNLIYSKIRRALIAELKKKYVNRSIQCKVKQCAKCKRKHKDCSITPYCKNFPVSACRYSCSAYCNPCCHELHCTLPCRSILSKNASKCKKRGKKCKNKRFSSHAHHCDRSNIYSIRCHIRKLLRLLILGKESCGCKRKCCRRPKVQDDPNKIFLNTVRKPRYIWIYRLCPWAYPECLKCLGIWKQNIQIILVIIAWILWCPCIVLMELFRLCCCYFCYE